MSTESVDEAMPEADSAVVERPALDHDPFLQEIVDMANMGLEIGLTVHVRGLVVSGILTSGATYFDAFAEIFADKVISSWDKEAREEVRAGIASNSEVFRGEKRDRKPPRFIHFREARVFDSAGAPLPNNEGTLWRGRISEVSGFWLGLLATTTSS